MDILFLGNGFDLYHHLPTKYINFINVVKCLKENCSSTESVTIGKVFNFLTSDPDISQYYEHCRTYSTFPLDLTSIHTLIELSKNNYWFKYFSELVNEDITWIDFEIEIEKVINAFNHFFETLSSIDVVFVPLSVPERTIIKKFNFFFSIIKDGKIVNGKADRMVANDDFLSRNPLDNKNYIDKDKIIKRLYDELIDLSYMLKLYLKIFVDDIFEKLHNLPRVNDHVALSQISHIITLNYTHTFERLYSANNAKVYHIHGDIDNRIILGINSNDDDKIETINTDFLSFKKYFQRVFYRSDIDYRSFIKHDEIYKKIRNNTLYVFGHSLNISDKDIIEELFSMANTIKVYSHDEKAMATHIINLINIFGKEGFDYLRLNNNLTFILLNQK